MWCILSHPYQEVNCRPFSSQFRWSMTLWDAFNSPSEGQQGLAHSGIRRWEVTGKVYFGSVLQMLSYSFRVTLQLWGSFQSHSIPRHTQGCSHVLSGFGAVRFSAAQTWRCGQRGRVRSAINNSLERTFYLKCSESKSHRLLLLKKTFGYFTWGWMFP